MSKPLESIYATLPQDLDSADDVLTRYGRWAASRPSQARCGSAERNYRPRNREEDREPARVGMPAQDATRAHRALLCVPEKHRRVLFALYVPDRVPAPARLRHLGIPPSMSRDLHLAGLRMFWDNYSRLVSLAPMIAGISTAQA